MRRAGIALMAAASLLPAPAQQSIQFSRPANQDPAANANSFLPTTHQKSVSDYNAPSSPLGGDDSFDKLPMGPAPVMSGANSAQWQKYVDSRTKWTMMTPAEILGIPTPEQILGITDPNIDPNASVEERFLLRQQHQDERGATNGMMRPDGSWLRDDGKKTPDTFSDSGRETLFGRTFGSAFDAKKDDPLAAAQSGISARLLRLGPGPLSDQKRNQVADDAWTSPFGTPANLPQSTPGQLAGMERFRAMLESEVPVAAKTPGDLYGFKAVISPDTGPQSQFNPAGQSVKPLEDGITRPTGIQPLAGVTGPRTAPAKAPSLVQLPPWLVEPSANSAPPQRQF